MLLILSFTERLRRPVLEPPSVNETYQFTQINYWHLLVKQHLVLSSIRNG